MEHSSEEESFDIPYRGGGVRFNQLVCSRVLWLVLSQRAPFARAFCLDGTNLSIYLLQGNRTSTLAMLPTEEYISSHFIEVITAELIAIALLVVLSALLTCQRAKRAMLMGGALSNRSMMSGGTSQRSNRSMMM